MLYITLHNLHTWGKTYMTKAGDICVAASLAESTEEKTVHVAATSDHNLSEIKDLYRSVKFKKFDASNLSNEDVVVIPILEFSRIIADTRDELVKFYQDLLDSDAKLIVMNIHHNRLFYRKTIDSIDDQEVADLVEKILRKCIYLVHDECMKLEEYNSEFIEQIVFYDESKMREIDFDQNRRIGLTFYRPSSFKGFNLWLEETEKEKTDRLVAVCNTSANPKYHALVDEYESKGLITVYRSIYDYLMHPCDGHALISSPYNIDSAAFQSLIRKSWYCLNTTDYNVLAQLNDGEKPDYLILENAMFDASLNGLTLRWTDSSIATMPERTAIMCSGLNEMTHVEQSVFFSQKYNAENYLKKIEGIACK